MQFEGVWLAMLFLCMLRVHTHVPPALCLGTLVPRQKFMKVTSMLLPSYLQEVFYEEALLLVVCEAGQDVTVQPYLFNPSATPLTVTPVECCSPPDVSISRFLTQHTALLRVLASLPLYITSAKRRKISIFHMVNSIPLPSGTPSV